MGQPADTRFLRFRALKQGPLDRLYVEVRRDGKRGISWREVGLSTAGEVVHRMPSALHRHGDYGLLDNASVSFDLATETNDLGASEFESIWSQPDLDPPPPSLARVKGLVGRMRQEVSRSSQGGLERDR